MAEYDLHELHRALDKLRNKVLDNRDKLKGGCFEHVPIDVRETMKLVHACIKGDVKLGE